VACLALTIIGTAAEIIGFGLALYEVTRTQRRELPDYVPVHHRGLRWLRRRLGLAKSASASVHTSSIGSSETLGYPTVKQKRQVILLEDRVKELGEDLDALASKQREGHALLEGLFVVEAQRTTETANDLQRQLNEMEAQRKENLRTRKRARSSPPADQPASACRCGPVQGRPRAP